MAERARLDDKDTIKAARELVRRSFMGAGSLRTLQFHRGNFWRLGAQHYEEFAEEDLRACIWRFQERHVRPLEGSRFQPTRQTVGNVLSALVSVCLVDSQSEVPAWLEHAPKELAALPARDFLCVRNGLLHVPSGILHPRTAALFTTNGSNTSFDAKASEPTRWMAFLQQVFGDDHEACATLQEWIGYNLTPDTTQQKSLLIVGPKRAGKGTIAKVLTALVGPGTVGSMTLTALSQQFGLQQLIGKQCCIMPDVRFGGRSDATSVAERLLSITGEDRVAIDRKYLPPWVGQLTTRFTLMTNEVPNVPDASGALLERFIVLELKQSFAGREDIKLVEKLMEEIPGILNWALQGYMRLRERGRFEQPVSGRAAIELMSAITSPVKAFVDERCTLGVDLSVPKDALFREWVRYCHETNQHPGAREIFCRNMKAAFPQLEDARPTVSGRRVRMFTGITIGTAGYSTASEDKVIHLNRRED